MIGRILDTVDPSRVRMRNLRDENLRVAANFRAEVAEAPRGHYFRTLAEAAHKSQPFGQPADMLALVTELARLEERVDQLERLAS